MVDGTLQGGLVAAHFEQVAAFVAVGDEERAKAEGFVARELDVWEPLAAREVSPIDLHLHGQGSIETPLGGGDAEDELLLVIADGVVRVAKIVEEDIEVGGVFVGEEEVLGGEAVRDAVAAGGGFALGGAGAGTFLCVFSIGCDLGL